MQANLQVFWYQAKAAMLHFGYRHAPLEIVLEDVGAQGRQKGAADRTIFQRASVVACFWRLH